VPRRGWSNARQGMQHLVIKALCSADETVSQPQIGSPITPRYNIEARVSQTGLGDKLL